MKFTSATAVCLTFLLSQASAIAIPFANSEFSLNRRNNKICPRTTKEYEWCDAVSRCCQPGYGCNTCGEGNVGQSCVKRQKDHCKSDKDCYWSQKCIDNGKEPSFCAQLWVDTPPKHKPSKTKLMPAASSFAGSFGASSFASSFMMAPSMMPKAPPKPMMPTPKPEPQPKPEEKKPAPPQPKPETKQSAPSPSPKGPQGPAAPGPSPPPRQ